MTSVSQNINQSNIEQLGICTVKISHTGTLNSTYNEVTFNEKLPITKQYLHTKYTYSPINKLPLMKSHL